MPFFQVGTAWAYWIGFESEGHYGCSDQRGWEGRWTNGGGIRVPQRQVASPLVCHAGPALSNAAELSALDQVVSDAPAHDELTVLTDNLSSMQKLQDMQRRDFSEWLTVAPQSSGEGAP